NGIDFVMPEEHYVGLFSSSVSADGSGTELKHKGYSRALVKMSVPINGYIENGHEVLFDYATSKWAEAIDIALFDSKKGGNLLFYGPLKEPTIIGAGKNASFVPGTISVEIVPRECDGD
ncbi:MAG: hypothetical protein KAH01_05935, partial [Caldisericia bacterium]|nr:hypothetical protein [Caldisericia bacterium]